MTEEQDPRGRQQLETVSNELARSLERCHTIIDHYRARIAANSERRQAANDDDASRLG